MGIGKEQLASAPKKTSLGNCQHALPFHYYFVSAVLAAEDNSRLAFSTAGEGGALGIQVGGGWVRPISVRFGMGRD